MAGNVGWQEFQVRCAGGVVRHYSLDDSVLGMTFEFGPEAVLVQFGADGRAALMTGVTIANLLSGE